MRVLHLPWNIASIISHQVRAEIAAGIDSIGLVLESGSRITSSQGVAILPLPRRRDVVGWLHVMATLQKEAKAADVVHWYFGRSIAPFELDLELLKRLGRPGLVEFLGSDIRNPDIERSDNPYYAAAFERGYEYREEESAARSEAAQKAFMEAGFIPVVPNGMVQHLIPDAGHVAVVMERGVVLDDYPLRDRPRRAVPVVVHAPSAPVAKGTALIEQAVEALRNEVAFEYVRLHGVSRNRALEVMADADIVVDQVVLGDYGMTAIEAMALGKPVVAWVKPSVRALYPDDLPVVNAAPHQLKEVLYGLLVDRQRCEEIGRNSRLFAERYHNAALRARMMQELYAELMARGSEG